MPTRVLAYEYLSSGALAGRPGAASLAREGGAMLSAVLADLARCDGVAVSTVVGEPRPPCPGVTCFPCPPGGEEAAFRRAARGADLALVIAPEFDDLLARRCAWAVEEGCGLLGPSVAAVRLTADKLRLADHLSRSGVPTVPTVPLTDGPRSPGPWVCKPRSGAGSQATFLVRREEELPDLPRRAHAEGSSGELVLQPYLAPRDGALSLACLVGPGRCFPLPLLRQTLSDDGRFRYLGGERAPGLDEEPYRRLARSAIAAVPGLAGYVGLDLLWPAGAPGPVVVEINPRLTTSYVGLRALAEGNLMRALLDVALGRPGGEGPVFRAGGVRFAADGSVSA